MKEMLFILYCSFLSALACGQSAFTKDNLIKDIDAYKEGIHKNHINPFTKISAEEFDKGINGILNKATRYNTDELLVALMQINAMIEDEHTTIKYWDSSSEFYPFKAYWFEEGIYITAVDNLHSRSALTKIVALNNIPVETVEKKLATLIPGKNNMSIKDRLPELLNVPRLLHGLEIIDSTYILTLSSMNAKGDTVLETFVPVQQASLKIESELLEKRFLRNKEQGNYWFKYDSVDNLLYFKYSRCMEDKSKPFEEFERQLEKEIRKQRPDRVIIDLRYNSGGSSIILTPFIQWLSGSRMDKKGKLFVLIGRHTFSAAVLNSVALKRNTKAILAGEETSGSVNHFGEVKVFDLPNTGMKVVYSTKHIVLNSTYEGTLLPDFRVYEKFADYVKGVDALMDYVSIAQVK